MEARRFLPTEAFFGDYQRVTGLWRMREDSRQMWGGLSKSCRMLWGETFHPRA